MSSNKLPYIAQVLCVFIVMLASKSHALESSVQLHKVDQDKSYGYSLSIGDEFFNQKAFNWQVSYNRLENVAISDLDEISKEWDKAGFDFTIQTVDLSLGYRYYPQSYDKFISSLMLEFQLGASINLSENKLIPNPDLNVDDIYFAEQGDINPVMSISLQKSFTKNSAMHIGFKHYPSYSDFGSISTVFIGFNYRFGRQVGY
ncbi:hypothetical protein [Colwellia psychrerythraea]|uniref:Outer membrane protein beta-barrel domain-containing protein n=1 Tax=Colwellia psychrerythraea (strain 34H / ATCC BAA-681) TaxID=167879 RepID=Q482Z1_COLP3|nr:hypothetical protein [Colwellia psychrerythraea]AAZ27303.1 hypothetical protein CPS_2151 [Colwellia psychrerythraea 34H]